MWLLLLPMLSFFPPPFSWEIHGAPWQLTGAILSSPCWEGVNECVRGADIVCHRNRFCLFVECFLSFLPPFLRTEPLCPPYEASVSAATKQQVAELNISLQWLELNKVLLSPISSPLVIIHSSFVGGILFSELWRHGIKVLYFLLCNCAQNFLM